MKDSEKYNYRRPVALASILFLYSMPELFISPASNCHFMTIPFTLPLPGFSSLQGIRDPSSYVNCSLHAATN